MQGAAPPGCGERDEIRSAGDRLGQPRGCGDLERLPFLAVGLRTLLFSPSSESTALGKRAMITMVSSRMKSNAPVSLVTTTATNESSPELPNSELEPPPRRDRRIQTPPGSTGFSPCQDFRGQVPVPLRFRAQATRIESGRCEPGSVRSSKSFLTMFR